MKKFKYIYLAICLIFRLSACTAGQPGGTAEEPSHAPTWQEQYDLGIRYLSEGNYQEAIIAFAAAIEIDPKRAPAYVGRGDAYAGTAKLAIDPAAPDELPPAAVSAYQSALTDYLSAIELDESDVSLYQKAAEIYVAQGNVKSAKELLRRGIKATGNEDLQIYLEDLEKPDTLFVLVREESYAGNSHSWSVYAYDELGYQISWSTWSGYDGLCWHSVTWVYDEEQNVWNKTTIENEKTTTETIESRTTGTVDRWHGHYYNEEEYVYTNPFDPNGCDEGFTAKYTYDENGNVVRIDTHNSAGTLSGYCILTWEKMEPAVTSQ